MTLTELKYIIAVAQEKHFGRAAQRCFVSQPTLSIAIKKLEEDGYGNYPICVAKTQYSFATDPALRGAPSGHSVNIREVQLAAGAEFIVMMCGDVMLMPGLPKAGVQSRIVMTPEHAKRLMFALQDNVTKYEQNFGQIRMPEQQAQGGKTFVPPLSDFKGEA